MPGIESKVSELLTFFTVGDASLDRSPAAVGVSGTDSVTDAADDRLISREIDQLLSPPLCVGDDFAPMDKGSMFRHRGSSTGCPPAAAFRASSSALRAIRLSNSAWRNVSSQITFTDDGAAACKATPLACKLSMPILKSPSMKATGPKAAAEGVSCSQLPPKSDASASSKLGNWQLRDAGLERDGAGCVASSRRASFPKLVSECSIKLTFSVEGTTAGLEPTLLFEADGVLLVLNFLIMFSPELFLLCALNCLVMDSPAPPNDGVEGAFCGKFCLKFKLKLK
mmetsp:Transcript_19092/g.34587  ORF Transcript_19092/g.34587 Transcript_19092/m.34587 type:complete len:282 (+) Transcript_19092:570-1415(+)